MSQLAIKVYTLKSNGWFSLVDGPFKRKQHPNQQGGLDTYVRVLDHDTGEINTVKLYENTKGLHFKKRGSWYLADFNSEVDYVPFQVISREPNA